MKNKYLKFSFEDLLEDQEFIFWALYGIHDYEWNSFLSEYQDFNIIAQKAKKILLLLKDKYDKPDREDVLTMWQNIERYHSSHQKKGNAILFRKFYRYAAILIITLSIGAIGYRVLNQNPKTYVYTVNTDPGSGNQSRLLLSNGTTVSLEKENSKVALTQDQKIVINNEKVIDLSKESKTDEIKMNEVVTPFGKKSQLILEDGTRVWLNAGSRMAFPTRFNDKNREIYLDGEAYFEVTHNSEKPFLVNAGEIALKVLGTRFDLSAYSSDKEIVTVLLEGSVALKDNSSFGLSRNDVILEPGQKASFTRSNKVISIEEESDTEFFIAWTQGWFLFSKENLDIVFNKLERYYNVKFIYDKSFLSNDLISGKLDLKDSIEEVLINLSELSKLTYRIENENIYILKN